MSLSESLRHQLIDGQCEVKTKARNRSHHSECHCDWGHESHLLDKQRIVQAGEGSCHGKGKHCDSSL